MYLSIVVFLGTRSGLFSPFFYECFCIGRKCKQLYNHRISCTFFQIAFTVCAYYTAWIVREARLYFLRVQLYPEMYSDCTAACVLCIFFKCRAFLLFFKVGNFTWKIFKCCTYVYSLRSIIFINKSEITIDHWIFFAL